jgi:hypothetical protein
MHFLRRAHELYQLPPGSELSPSFWDADGLTPADWAGFAAIRPGIDSALARLLYTSGAIEEAARIYLRLLRPLAPEPRWLLVDGSDRSLVEAQQREQVLLDDFEGEALRAVHGCVGLIGVAALPVHTGKQGEVVRPAAPDQLLRAPGEQGSIATAVLQKG